MFIYIMEIIKKCALAYEVCTLFRTSNYYRIAVLEKIQYESEGRSKMSSPLLMTISGFTGGIVVFIIQKLIGL